MHRLDIYLCGEIVSSILEGFNRLLGKGGELYKTLGNLKYSYFFDFNYNQYKFSEFPNKGVVFNHLGFDDYKKFRNFLANAC